MLFALKTRELFFTELFGVLIAKTRKSFLAIQQDCFLMLNAQRQMGEDNFKSAEGKILKDILLGNLQMVIENLEKFH